MFTKLLSYMLFMNERKTGISTQFKVENCEFKEEGYDSGSIHWVGIWRIGWWYLHLSWISSFNYYWILPWPLTRSMWWMQCSLFFHNFFSCIKHFLFDDSLLKNYNCYSGTCCHRFWELFSKRFYVSMISSFKLRTEDLLPRRQ